MSEDKTKVKLYPPGGGAPVYVLAQSVARMTAVGWTRADDDDETPAPAVRKARKKAKGKAPADGG